MVYRILCVGDGDMSLSLSLVRAYGQKREEMHDDAINEVPQQQQEQEEQEKQEKQENNINENILFIVTTTIIQSKEILVKTYPNTVPYIVKELEGVQEQYTNIIVHILYNIDACTIHTNKQIQSLFILYNFTKFNIILFHHPHLGDIISNNNSNNTNTTNDNKNNNNKGQHEQEQEQDQEQEQHSTTSMNNNKTTISEIQHITNHHILLSHYLYSASIISYNVHVCLCGNQVISWRLYTILQRLSTNLYENTILSPLSVTKPFHIILFGCCTTTGSTCTTNSTTDNNTTDNSTTTGNNGICTVQMQQEEGIGTTNVTNDCISCYLPVLVVTDTKNYHHHGRRGRQLKSNSVHWLSKYGYQHVRTIGDVNRLSNSTTISKSSVSSKLAPPNLIGSKHYVFKSLSSVSSSSSSSSNIHNNNNNNNNNSSNSSNSSNSNNNNSNINEIYERKNNNGTTYKSKNDDFNSSQHSSLSFCCYICESNFTTQDELDNHVNDPLDATSIAEISLQYKSINKNNTKSTQIQQYLLHKQQQTQHQAQHQTQAQQQEQKQSLDSLEEHNDSTIMLSNEQQQHDITNRCVNVIGTKTDIKNTCTSMNNEIIVNKIHDGKRLRWYLQHCLVNVNNNELVSNTYHPCQEGISTITLSSLSRTRTGTGTKQRSKREWEELIRNGFVTINGLIATDTGRILHTGYTIGFVSHSASTDKEIISSDSTITTKPVTSSYEQTKVDCKIDDTSNGMKPIYKQSTTNPIEIVATLNIPYHIQQQSEQAQQQQQQQGSSINASNNLLVVWKPNGMRSIGSFDSQTLEETISHIQCKQYYCLTNLDTGCSGLCVLSNIRPDPMLDVRIERTFTCLVYGIVPSQWINGQAITLSVEKKRRWKKLTSVSSIDKKSDTDTIDTSNMIDNAATIRLLETCNEEENNNLHGNITNENNYNNNNNNSSTIETVLSLSTIEISTYSRVSGIANCIAHYLRTVCQHSVVGDRYATLEYLSLPRSIRNRIKQRLCMGCTKVKIEILYARCNTMKNNDNNSVIISPQSDVEHYDDDNRIYYHEVEYDIPNKWKVSYWKTFCMQKCTNEHNTGII